MIDFSNPTSVSVTTPQHVVLGDGSSSQIPQLLSNWKIPPSDVLIVSDPEVIKLGLLEGIKGSLHQAGYEPDIFDEISGEPTLKTAENLASAVRRKPFRSVIGVGGGSAMDMAKLASAMATNKIEIRNFLGAVTFPNEPLPLTLVPTTAGTGAEATAVSMLSVDGRKAIVLSPQLIPLAAVLDPLLTLSLPANVTAITGLDALSHALEAFMSRKANPFTDTHAVAATGLIADWLKAAFDNGRNLEARRAMSYAAFLGGLSLNAGVVVGHSVAYTISNRTHLPHGVSCALALPYTIAFNISAREVRLRKMAEIVIKNPAASATDLALWVDYMNSYLGMPRSLSDVGLGPSSLDEMVEECLTRYPRPTNPVELSRERLKPLYEAMLAGDVEGFATRCAQHA